MKTRKRRTTGKTRIKMIVQSPSDHNQTILIPYAVAWAAARGIIGYSHHAVILYGEFGTAHFRHDGTGYVEWNERATRPGEKTEFGNNATVSI